MAKFQPGNSGRPRGARNKLSGDFIGALAEEFAAHGQDAIRIVRVERPHEFLKIVASLMPREIDITTTQLETISDDELERLIDYARQQLAAPDRLKLVAPSIIDGEKAETGGE